jgi:hypothetical protein
MNRVGIALIALGASLCFGLALASAQQATTPVPTGHGPLPVKVTKTLDSSKLKEGDAFEVETAGSFKLPDGTLVPKGSKIAGHVVAAKARSKGDPDSELTLSFDKLDISGGKQLSLKGDVQAVYPPAEEPTGPNMATAGTSQGGSGAGGSSAGVGITNANNGSNMESSGGQYAMDMKFTGVQGLHDLTLDNGILKSKGKNVKLGGGVRMVVRADILG